MLSEEQNRIIERLETLRKEVELLESHKKVYGDDKEFGLLTQKQYYEAGCRIVMALEEIEIELGVGKKESSMNHKLRMITKTIDEIHYMLTYAIARTDEELYSLETQNTMNEVKYEYANKAETD